MGGVAIYAAFSLTVLRNFTFSQEVIAVILAGTLILIVGLIDDLRELPATFRLLFQLVAVAVVIRYGVVIGGPRNSDSYVRWTPT